MFKTIGRLCYDHLIRPFQETHAPVREVSWGAAIGMLVAMTPTVGAQMYIAAMLWVIFRYVLRFRFNLPIAIAMVWISNPVTVVPIYYVFLLTGDWALRHVEELADPMTYAQFKAAFAAAVNAPGLDWQERIVAGVLLLFWEFGWPMVVGSFFWAVPLAILSYPATSLSLHWYRRRRAAEAGLSYEEWNRRFVRRYPIPVVPAPAAGPAPPVGPDR